MSTQNKSILTLSVMAAAALTAQTFVTAGGAVATAAGNAFGVTRANAATGQLAPVDVLGTVIVTASAAIAQFASVQVAAAGQAVTKTGGVTVGIALQAATAAGDSIEILLIPNAA